MNSLLVQKIESIKKQYHEMSTLKLCEAFLRFLLCGLKAAVRIGCKIEFVVHKGLLSFFYYYTTKKTFLSKFDKRTDGIMIGNIHATHRFIGHSIRRSRLFRIRKDIVDVDGWIFFYLAKAVEGLTDLFGNVGNVRFQNLY